jgi:hypothetical protein
MIDFFVPVYVNVNIAGFLGHLGLSVSFLRAKIPALGSQKSFIERIHRGKQKFFAMHQKSANLQHISSKSIIQSCETFLLGRSQFLSE